MDTQIMEKLRLAQMVVDILQDSNRNEKQFVLACVEQLRLVRNELDKDLKQAKGDAFMNAYTHMTSMIDKCNETISRYGYDEDLKNPTP